MDQTVVVPDCICGASRVFECQLMSTILHELHVSSDGMDWGIAAIYTCSANCNRSCQEAVVIQSSL